MPPPTAGGTTPVAGERVDPDRGWDLGEERSGQQRRAASPSLRDIFYSPFYAKLPYKPGLPPGRGISSLAREEQHARSEQRQGTSRVSRIHEPFAMLHSTRDLGKATSQYRHIQVETVGEYRPPAHRDAHVRAQARSLAAVAENAPSLRAAVAVKAQLLPAALIECEKDCPAYSFLLRALAASVEKYDPSFDHGKALDSAELDVRLCAKHGQAVRFEGDPEGSGGFRGPESMASLRGSMGSVGSAGAVAPDAGQASQLPQTSQPTQAAQSAFEVAEEDSLKYGSELASLSRLVAKREVEAQAYTQRLRGLEESIAEVCKEIEIAKASIKSVNLEISRFEAFQQMEAEAKAGAARKLRGEGRYSSSGQATGQAALERLRNADSLEKLAK